MYCMCKHEGLRQLYTLWWGFIVRTWVVDEVGKVIEMGCSLVAVFEVCKYQVTCFDKGTNSWGLLAEYVNMIQKLKKESFSYSCWIQGEEDKDKYIEDYRRAEGIALEKSSISKNVGQRLAKMKLNSMWCKWAQNQNMTHTSIPWHNFWC